MSQLAGIFYFDLRMTVDSDAQRISSALERGDGAVPRLFQRPGLIMGYAASHGDPSPDHGWCTSPEGLHCTWDGRLDNAGDLHRHDFAIQQT